MGKIVTQTSTKTGTVAGQDEAVVIGEGAVAGTGLSFGTGDHSGGNRIDMTLTTLDPESVAKSFSLGQFAVQQSGENFTRLMNAAQVMQDEASSLGRAGIEGILSNTLAAMEKTADAYDEAFDGTSKAYELAAKTAGETAAGIASAYATANQKTDPADASRTVTAALVIAGLIVVAVAWKGKGGK